MITLVITEKGNILNISYISFTYNYHFGGEGGIRTHGRRKPSEVFKTSAFDHSATSPMIEGSDQAEILSAPAIQGRRASGMTMLPSGCW